MVTLFDSITLSQSCLHVLRQSVSIPTHTILFVEGSGNYTKFWLADGNYVLTSKSLSFYESMLPNYIVRVHKSHYVNLCQVESIDANYLYLKNNQRILIARRRKKTVFTCMAYYQGKPLSKRFIKLSASIKDRLPQQ
jgi:two-component system, LytTR family, response regulator